MTTLAIVTPWMNHHGLYGGYVAAVEPELRTGDELIVVDNGSTPPLDFAEVRSETNLGFCGGSNLGLAEARERGVDAVLFLNNDIHAGEPGWIDELRRAVEPGVFVGRLLHAPHTIVDGIEYPYLAGWALCGMLDDVLAIGGWDEDLEEPAYYSDNILSFEARVAGITLRDVPVRVRHHEGMTARNDSAMLDAAARNRETYIAKVRGTVTATT